MDVRKIFVNEDREALIICDGCGKSRKAHVGHAVMKSYRPVKVNCPCGRVFHVIFEKRTHFRKGVGFVGGFRLLDQDEDQKRLMYVVDVSRKGLRFRVSGEHGLQLEDVVKIHFDLEGKTKVPIRATAVVKSVRGGYVGVEFKDLSEYFQKEIGYFLMP